MARRPVWHLSAVLLFVLGLGLLYVSLHRVDTLFPRLQLWRLPFVINTQPACLLERSAEPEPVRLAPELALLYWDTSACAHRTFAYPAFAVTVLSGVSSIGLAGYVSRVGRPTRVP
ncbi:MAG: hypothetical protein ABEJ42_09040 [Halobacteriaceae archaeon]